MRRCSSVMPLPVSLTTTRTFWASMGAMAMVRVPPSSMASRALASKLLRICVSCTCWLSTIGVPMGSNSTLTRALTICCSNAARLSYSAATRLTGSTSSLSGRRDCSNSRTHFDMRSTWPMMSLMFLCAAPLSNSSASSALERMVARGLRRLWATAEDISPRATKVSLVISCFCCVASRIAARRTIQYSPR
ncbi:hypothetical protein D3C84_777190 [compost metagenome]